MNQSLLTVKEASSFLCVHPKTLYLWTRQGRIPFSKPNGQVRFSEKDIEQWLNERKYTPVAPPTLNIKSDISLVEYDKMLLKGRSALSKKISKRWNYGCGTVYIRKTTQGKIRWYIEYQSNGKRIRSVVKDAQDRSQAVLVLQEKVHAEFNKKHNTDEIKRKVTFTELAEMYIDDYAKTNKDSWKVDEYRIDAHMKPYFGDYLLQDINPQMIEQYRTKRLQKNVTKSTTNREITIMKRMFNLAIDWKFSDENPAAKVKLFSEKDAEKERILTEEEEVRLFAESPDYLKSIITIALNTGMRKGEIFNLEWKNVDLERGQIIVKKTKRKKNRIIPINEVLAKELLKLKEREENNVLVFPNPKTGQPYTDVKKSFKEACRKAGIEDLRFHDLRHTFATRLIESGVDIITVRDLLGHFSVRITQRYTHSNQQQKMNAVDMLTKKRSKKAEIPEDLSHSPERRFKQICK